jgi:TP53 regulating kinase-like protein
MENESFRGAESRLYQRNWFDFEALYKVRLPKSYRVDELDTHFRKQRTIYEARILSRAKKAGVRVPIIYEIDLQNATIVMELIQGEIMKTYFPKIKKKEMLDLSYQIGYNIGLLHKEGIVHGDLTTSNIIKILNKNQLAFIDFGLGYISDKLEDFGIDLYLLERAIRNSHHDFFNDIWKKVLEGYYKTSPYKDKIKDKLLEIASRGRYSERI